jgi:hypothetical protein
VSLPKPHSIGAPRDAVAGNSLSVAKTGERVALIVQAKTDTLQASGSGAGSCYPDGTDVPLYSPGPGATNGGTQ